MAGLSGATRIAGSILGFCNLRPPYHRHLPLGWSFFTWVVLSATFLALLLHSLAILPLAWTTEPLQNVSPLQGLAYQGVFDAKPNPTTGAPPAVLLEDGTPIGFQVETGWGVVSTLGEGRYYLAERIVYFSSSDSSDPTSNSRSYEVRYPQPVNGRLVRVSGAFAVLATLALAVRHRFALVSTPLPAYVFFAGLFLVNRLWIFVDFPIAGIHPDSASYYQVAEAFQNRQVPHLGMRPPGYPLLMALVYSVSDSAMSLVLVQNLLSLGAGLLMIRSVHALAPALAPVAALLLAGFFMSVVGMEHDTALLSESLYTSSLIAAFALLLFGLRREAHWVWLALSSTAMALSILTRPGGLFLVVTVALIIAFLVWNRYGWRRVLATSAPMATLLFATSIVNWITIGVFSVTAWGEANLAVGTFTFWEKDDDYPPEINDSIERIQAIITRRFDVTGKDPAILGESWDPFELSSVFVEGFNGEALDVAMHMGGDYYAGQGRRWIRRIALDSIAKNPTVYAKFVYAMLSNYYRPSADFDFRAYLLNRVAVIFEQGHFSEKRGLPFMVRLGKEFADGDPPTNVRIANTDPSITRNLNERVLLTATPLWRAYESMARLRRPIFIHSVWSIAFFVILVASSIALILSRGRSLPAFLLFIVTISEFGASLVVSLVEYSQPRYSYPMEWTRYLAVVLLPLLLWPTPGQRGLLNLDWFRGILTRVRAATASPTGTREARDRLESDRGRGREAPA